MTERLRGIVEVPLTINGDRRVVATRPGDTLLRTLRENIGLTGTKMGCENGDCGACTVLLDDMAVKSCYTLTVDVGNREITTIEGLHDTAVQKAFVEEYGFQCGFCTPGMIVKAFSLFEADPHPDAHTVRTWMEGNLCRCTGYEGIENAVNRLRSGSPRRRESPQ